jgi:hypothetical protein
VKTLILFSSPLCRFTIRRVLALPYVQIFFSELILKHPQSMKSSVFRNITTFRKNISPPSSGSKCKTSKKPAWSRRLAEQIWFLLQGRRLRCQFRNCRLVFCMHIAPCLNMWGSVLASGNILPTFVLSYELSCIFQILAVQYGNVYTFVKNVFHVCSVYVFLSFRVTSYVICRDGICTLFKPMLLYMIIQVLSSFVSSLPLLRLGLL